MLLTKNDMLHIVKWNTDAYEFVTLPGVCSRQWRQAQMMMEFACRQLAVAVQKWQDLPEVPHT